MEATRIAHQSISTRLHPTSVTQKKKRSIATAKQNQTILKKTKFQNFLPSEAKRIQKYSKTKSSQITQEFSETKKHELLDLSEEKKKRRRRKRKRRRNQKKGIMHLINSVLKHFNLQAKIKLNFLVEFKKRSKVHSVESIRSTNREDTKKSKLILTKKTKIVRLSRIIDN